MPGFHNMPPPLTVHWNNIPHQDRPVLQGVQHLPFDRMNFHPVARLARGFARLDLQPHLTHLVQVQGIPNNTLPEITHNDQQVTCWANIELKKLVSLLHRQFCETHLSDLRQNLNPYGQHIMDHLVIMGTRTWADFVTDDFQKMYEGRGVYLYWFDKVKNRCFTIDPNSGDSHISHLLPHMALEFRNRVFGHFFPWSQHEITMGCTPHERVRRLEDAWLIADHALPIITHVPGLRRSFLKNADLGAAIVNKTREISKLEQKIWQISETPPKSTTPDGCHLKLVYSSP